MAHGRGARLGSSRRTEAAAIRHFFLESPYWLIPVLAVVEYVLLVIWLRRRTRGARRALLGGLALCVALPLVQWLTVTDQERLRAVCGALVVATAAGDIDALAVHVSPRFDVRGIDRDQFLARVAQTLHRVQIENAHARYDEIVMHGVRAEVRFHVRCRVVAPEAGPIEIANSAWLATFVRDGDDWRLVAVDPQPTPVFPVSRLEDLWR